LHSIAVRLNGPKLEQPAGRLPRPEAEVDIFFQNAE
jgi:hypothetical protein